jgi:hypothetical protein
MSPEVIFMIYLEVSEFQLKLCWVYLPPPVAGRRINVKLIFAYNIFLATFTTVYA